MKKYLKLLNKLSRNKKIFNIFKILFLLLGLLFLFIQISFTDFGPLKNLSFINFFALLLIVLTGTTFFALPWCEEYNTKDYRVNKIEYIKFYFQGQLGKYIPGSIWSVVGRISLASNDKISLEVSSKKTTKHLIQLWISCFIIGSIFYLQNIFYTIFALFVFIYFLKNNFYLIFYFLGWSLICLAYIYVAKYIFFDNYSTSKIISSSLFSWLGGFLFLPSPSGIGVREYLFTYFYNVENLFNELFIIATIIRFITIVNDVFGFVIYSFLHKLILYKTHD